MYFSFFPSHKRAGIFISILGSSSKTHLSIAVGILECLLRLARGEYFPAHLNGISFLYSLISATNFQKEATNKSLRGIKKGRKFVLLHQVLDGKTVFFFSSVIPFKSRGSQLLTGTLDQMLLQHCFT